MHAGCHEGLVCLLGHHTLDTRGLSAGPALPWCGVVGCSCGGRFRDVVVTGCELQLLFYSRIRERRLACAAARSFSDTARGRRGMPEGLVPCCAQRAHGGRLGSVWHTWKMDIHGHGVWASSRRCWRHSSAQ